MQWLLNASRGVASRRKLRLILSMKSFHYVFVVGCQRSGITLAGQILGTNPQAASDRIAAYRGKPTICAGPNNIIDHTRRHTWSEDDHRTSESGQSARRPRQPWNIGSPMRVRMSSAD